MYFRFNDESVRAIGRWAHKDMSLITTAAGAKLEIAFSGNLITLHFMMKNNEAPNPHLWLSLDGGPRFEVTLDHYIRVWSDDGGEHLLTVVYKGGQEKQSRWYEPLVSKVEFSGYDADDRARLPEMPRQTVEFVGDSITEGVTLDVHYSPVLPAGQPNRPYQDDSLATYAATAAHILELEPIFVGYGAVGTTKSGCGDVPPAALMYPYCFEGHPKEYGECDFVVINHGTNDRKSPEIFKEKYKELLSVIVKHNPNAKIAAMVPFIQAFRAEINEVVTEFNKENGTDIAVIETEGWVPPEPLHPSREGHKAAGERLAEELKKKFGL